VSHKVRFHNKADRGLTVTFKKAWPFVQAPVPIPLESGKTSKWFDTVEGIAKGSYPYLISPDLTPGDPTPDPPGISFNG
jgi:hypothetical protein